MGIFKYDGPLMTLLGKIGDIAILNALTILFCVPIVTIGASLTACHYTALKICCGEGYIIRNFWKSFKMNFKQATFLSLILFIFGGTSALAIWILSANHLGTIGFFVQGFLSMCVILTGIIGIWIFPLQARFESGVFATLMQSVVLSFRYIFKTIIMLVFAAIPLALLFVLPAEWYSVLLLFGCAGPIYWSAKMYRPIFEKLEEKCEENLQ